MLTKGRIDWVHTDCIIILEQLTLESIGDRVMKRIYGAPILAEVENMKNVLELNGIESTITNQFLSVGIGGIDCNPELWVEERDVERALEIIQTTDKGLNESQETWVCTQCNEEVEGQFSECWNCGKARSTEPSVRSDRPENHTFNCEQGGDLSDNSESCRGPREN